MGTSNTATATIFLPVLGSLGQSIELHPFYLMIPATVCASFAFMLPVATPPNAIVFGTGRIRIRDMAKAGFGMNIIAILIVTLGINTWGRAYYDLGTFPDWAKDGHIIVPTTAAAITTAVANTTAATISTTAATAGATTAATAAATTTATAAVTNATTAAATTAAATIVSTIAQATTAI